MTVNRTTLLDLPLPVTGTESGTWGDITNNGLTEYMDIAIAGMSNLTSADFTAGALTIETTEGNSAGTSITATSAQYAGFRVSSLAANSTITVGNTGTSPARSYRLINADATYNLTFKATGQTGVTLLPGQSAVVAFNGTDYVIVGTVGAGTATDNAVARFDGTTGEILQNSAATIDDTGAATFVGSVNVSGTSASAADLKLYEDTDNGTNYVAFKSPASVASNVTWTLPSADGTNGQALTTNGSGTLAFSSVTTAPGGSTTQVQYNNAGAFGGISNATTDGTTLSMTSPKVITGINDTNGNELLNVTATASAVNELTLANAATGGNPVLSATGGDTNIGITLTPKGTGGVVFPAGAVGTPAITTTGDTNTGVYFPAADTAAITTGGSEGARVDSSQNVLVNQTAAYATPVAQSSGWTPKLSVSQTSTTNIGFGIYSWSTYTGDLGGGNGLSDFTFSRSNSNNKGTHTAVTNGMLLGRTSFNGSDGTNFICGAYISGAVDGTPGTNDMPGRLVFGTTADGSASPTERMRISADGTIKTSSTISVGGATPSTSGCGITFPASENLSTNGNTLDDYEEGTWTTSFTYSNASAATLSAATYTKVGRLVTLSGKISATLTTTNTAISIIFTLPFTQGANLCPSTGLAYHTATATANAGIGFIADETGAAADKAAFGAPASQVTKADNSSFDIQFSYTYEAET